MRNVELTTLASTYMIEVLPQFTLATTDNSSNGETPWDCTAVEVGDNDHGIVFVNETIYCVMGIQITFSFKCNSNTKITCLQRTS